MKYLKLMPGSVSPLAVINDENSEVEVILDEELKKETLLGVHPNINTETILLSTIALSSVLYCIYLIKSLISLPYLKNNS